MTRSADPFPTGPYRRYPPVESRPVPPAAGAARPYSASQQAPSPARRSRASGAIFVALGVVLLIGIAGTLSYVAYRDHWIDLSDGTLPTASQRPVQNATVIFPGDEGALSPAQGNTVQADRSNPSIIWIRSSLTRAESSGSTDGVAVTVPSSLTAGLGGKRIRVTISAARGRSSGASSPFAVAYSTGAVGDSGWLVFEPTESFQDFSFRYRVPARAEGFTHYVGLWSDISGRETPLAVRRITITTLP